MTRREGADEPEIARERRELIDHLDVLAENGALAPCRTSGHEAMQEWTSDAVEEQRTAARACAGCPARTACREFGVRWPDLPGVYGGLTEPQRRREARAQTTKEKTA